MNFVKLNTLLKENVVLAVSFTNVSLEKINKLHLSDRSASVINEGKYGKIGGSLHSARTKTYGVERKQ